MKSIFKKSFKKILKEKDFYIAHVHIRQEGQKCLFPIIFASKNWVGWSVGNFLFSGNFSVRRVLLTVYCIWGLSSDAVSN